MNFQMARSNMVVQQIRPWSVSDDNVLKALSQIPRETFVPPAFVDLAYSDMDISISHHQTMLPPKVVGRGLQALRLTGQERILEVGTGTGYVTACLLKLAQSVISIEIEADLLTQATKNLASLNFRHLTLEEGDAASGWERFAPYDAIFVTGSYPLGVPKQITQQLKPKGRLFAFQGMAPSMEAVLIEPLNKDECKITSLFETVVPALIHAAQPQIFQF